ncbi:PIG-P-domain-containing protein [Trichophaea hybrida]|nr:PIG-P-domain-containing protein [Trichophaea hybrida]
MSRPTPTFSSSSSSSLAPPPFPTTSAELHPPSPRPPLNRSSSCHLPSRTPTPTPLHTFAPPFYNRPPTPLPPSPSLTSLLRPPFTPSRPTTPDSSDSEGITHSSQLSSRTPRYAPKVPTYEYYGFTLYVISSAAFVMYIFWSFAPAAVLEAVGLSYYPSRWWSLALPSYLVVVVCYIFVALAGYNTSVLTYPLGALETVVDMAGNIAAVEETGGFLQLRRWAGGYGKEREDGGEADWRGLWSRGTDAVMDVPIGGVCEVLYGEGREREEWEFGVIGGEGVCVM